MKALLTLLSLLGCLFATAAFATDAQCMQACEQIPDPCTKACSKKAGGNSGMCKAKCDDAYKKCKDNCAKRSP